MAELSVPQRRSGGRQMNRLPVRVDLTALVDLAFLLITFFILTTTLNKQKALPLVMPVPGTEVPVAASSTMTICLGKNNQAVYYLGLANAPLTVPKVVSCGNNMAKAILQITKQVTANTGKNLMVVIKPSDHSVYNSLVSTIDELNITNTQRYAIGAVVAEDVDMLKAKHIY